MLTCHLWPLIVDSPGPVAPLHWVQECVQSLAPNDSPLRKKILVGLNFYGYDFGASSMERKFCLFNAVHFCSSSGIVSFSFFPNFLLQL